MGSATGIGAVTARRLASEGAEVLLGDINTDGVKQVAEELGAPWRRFDLVDDDSVAQLIDAARSELGHASNVQFPALTQRQNARRPGIHTIGRGIRTTPSHRGVATTA